MNNNNMGNMRVPKILLAKLEFMKRFESDPLWRTIIQLIDDYEDSYNMCDEEAKDLLERC